MITETELKEASKKSQSGFSEIEPTWSSDASPSSRRSVRFENVQEVSEYDARREKGFSPTEKDQNAAYLKALRDLSTEKQKRRRKEKNMLKLAQELGHRTEQITDREKQLEALKSEIGVLKKKLFDSKSDASEERDEPGNAECTNRLQLSPTTEVKRLQNELNEKTQEVEMLQPELSAKAEALRSTEIELKRARDDMTELREQISKLQMACAKHVEEKNDAIHRMKSLETDLVMKDDLLLKQSASLDSTESGNQLINQAMKAEITELRETLKLTQASLIKLGEDAASHKQVLHDLKTEMAQKEKSLLSMQSDFAKEREEVERLTTLNKTLVEEHASTTSDLEGAKNEVRSLKADLLEKEQCLQDITASMQTNAKSLKLLQEESLSKDARLDTIMAELVRERSALRAVEERRHLLEAECQALRIAKDMSVQQNDTLKDEIRALKSSAMAEKLSEQSTRQLQTTLHFPSNEGQGESHEKDKEDEYVESVIEEDAIEANENLCKEQESRIESLESSRQRLLDDCNFLRLSLNKLEEENRCLLLKFDSDEKYFADLESRIQVQQKEATLVREELLGCKIEVQRLVKNDNDSSNGLSSAEGLLATQAKSVSDMLTNVASITRTMENMSRLKDMIEGLQQDLKIRDEKIAELQRGLHRLASQKSSVVDADERSERGITLNTADLDLDIFKEESQQSLENASENLSSVLSKLKPSDPSRAKLAPAVDRLQATCKDIMARTFVHLESEISSRRKMKVARDKAMQALSQNNGNMEETARKMKANIEKLNQEHVERIDELNGKLSQAIQSKQKATLEQEAALRAVESKYISKFEKLGKESEEMLSDFESHMQERIDKLSSKLDKKTARIRTLQRLVTHQLQTQRRGRSSRLPWFPILLVIFVAPLLLLLVGKADRQWVCAPVPPWERYQSNKVRTWHTWWSSFNKAEEPSSHPWWKWTDSAHLDWIEAKLCQSNMD